MRKKQFQSNGLIECDIDAHSNSMQAHLSKINRNGRKVLIDEGYGSESKAQHSLMKSILPAAFQAQVVDLDCLVK